jgi:formylglycine-generating enzyme required for sulfatase activity
VLNSVPIGLRADDGRSFYRLDTSTNSRIGSLMVDGMLSWSNASAPGDYVVERAADLTNDAWAPITRGTFTNPLWSVKVHDPSPPAGMCFIPGGRFTMGDILGDLNNASPVHTVFVSPFYLKQYEVTNDELRPVLQWAYDQGLISVTTNGIPSTDGSTNLLVALNRYNSDIAFSQGVFSVKAGRGGFPCVYVSWFGSAAYCNFLSLMAGMEPCYSLTNWTCDFTKPGYRLPTESEWEFAARGGYEGQRFPWADTNVITHSRANYRSDTNFWYDVSPTRGFHPDFADLRPRCSPVGYFPPNNYGLYDMSGNVWEWCWDWAARYSGETQLDPTGPATGTTKIFRGGSWLTVALSTTCASRYTAMVPDKVFDDIGLRTALPYRD